MHFRYRPFWNAGTKLTLRRDTIRLEHDVQGDFLFSKVRRRRVFYENELLFYLAYAATRGGIYVDVGANIGNHSIYFAKYLADFVLSIEPGQRLRAQLEQNLAANGLERVLVVGAAIGRERGSGRLIIPDGHADNLGMGRVALGAGERGEAVEIYSLQEVLRTHRDQLPEQRITLIKIDVEGMGPEVLEGCRGVLEEHRPQIVIEAETEPEYRAVLDLLTPLGYRLIGQFCATPTYFFADPRRDQPRERGFKYGVVNGLRVIDERWKRATRRIFAEKG